MSGGFVRSYKPAAAAHLVYDRVYAEYMALHDHFGRGASQAMARLRAIRDEAVPSSHLTQASALP
jgi:L-ribulokinase